MSPRQLFLQRTHVYEMVTLDPGLVVVIQDTDTVAFALQVYICGIRRIDIDRNSVKRKSSQRQYIPKKKGSSLAWYSAFVNLVG